MDDVDKKFRFFHASDMKWVDFSNYQLNEVAYKWVKEWEELRGENIVTTVWEEFSSTFVDHHIPLMIKADRAEKFMNLIKGKIITKEYALIFTQLFLYASEVVSNMRSRIRKFASRFSCDLMIESKDSMLNSDIDISKLMVYIE